ncbi:uncharacterized protein LOC120190947 [Hibiscus syriacus]|uniref:uncharacterized protein LOC120190947 n=1 Tax=Hibiscus syriacus TaxID=106335 RepID=UPI001922827D|nr:uncharacterized protein LOC120190947 [Hibiscus syriacus]
MASKLKNMNKDIIIFVALLGLILGVFARSCVQGPQKSLEEENKSYFRQQFDKVCSDVRRKIEDVCVTLTIKFIHFLVSRWLQLRYLPALFPAPRITCLLFWVAFTGSISSLPDNPLQ